MIGIIEIQGGKDGARVENQRHRYDLMHAPSTSRISS
jgi:hypothetical protein